MKQEKVDKNKQNPFHGEPFFVWPERKEILLDLFWFSFRPPSWDFIFNYDELSWEAYQTNTDNKLHICDNHLGKAWEKFECNHFSMDNV